MEQQIILIAALVALVILLLGAYRLSNTAKEKEEESPFVDFSTHHYSRKRNAWFGHFFKGNIPMYGYVYGINQEEISEGTIIRAKVLSFKEGNYLLEPVRLKEISGDQCLPIYKDENGWHVMYRNASGVALVGQLRKKNVKLINIL